LTVIAFFFAVSVMSVLVFLGFLLVLSPGTPTPFLDGSGRRLAGSISEKIKVHINGVDQGMFIKGKNTSNPVLLYLHGGMPDYFLTQSYPTGLDEDFTVVWWEQSGSGLSYDASARSQSINANQLLQDTLAVTHYLRTRFGQNKIYLMGHSGGTFLGIQAAAQAPEFYHAYIGVAQMSNQFASEKLAYAYMRERFRAGDDTKMLQRLDDSPVGDAPPLPASYLKIRDTTMHDLGVGTMHRMRSIFFGLLLPSLLMREYTLGEKINLWRSKISSDNPLWNTQLSTDLAKQVTRLAIPVYFIHGVYDYTVSYPLAKSYLEKLAAPVKGFYTFPKSAHSPLFEEPVKMQQIMRTDVLAGTKSLADPD
jgi:pimeloyl-ACP methyl ester carboxylesterase